MAEPKRMFDIEGCKAGLFRRAWCHFCYWLYADSPIPITWLPIGEMLSDAGCVAYACNRTADRPNCEDCGCLRCDPAKPED